MLEGIEKQQENRIPIESIRFMCNYFSLSDVDLLV